MRINRIKLLFVSALLLFAGCGGQQSPHIYVLAIDDSQSIEPQARTEAFAAVMQLVHAMKRGDRMAIIPISGDTSEAQGHILRLELSTQRQAYDQDIKQFSSKASKLLQNAQQSAAGNPSARTDILGFMQVAQQEMTIAPSYRPVLIVLSDFIQDDRAMNFDILEKVSTRAKGENFGKSEAISKAVRFSGVPVYLGWLRSRDFARLSISRREGIEAFWQAFFKQAGGNPLSATDGSGLLLTFAQGNEKGML